MSWQQTEFILKGMYLGLLLFVGLQLREPTWWLDLGYIALCTFGGLLLCLGVAALRKLREGYRIRGRLPAFILFLLLENPGLVYAGVILGLGFGAFTLREEHNTQHLIFTVGGGVILGQLFWLLVNAPAKNRMWLGLLLAAALVGGAIAVFHYNPVGSDGRPILPPPEQRYMLGALLLLGIPLFYLLTFASMVEETEVEIAAICSALGVGLWLVGEQLSPGSPTNLTVSLALPIGLYVVYSRRILPGLRVFKHVLRGISYANVGRWRPALISLNRAVQLDPNNALARETLWSVHRQMDLTQVVNDPDTLAQVNFELCLERVAWLLLQSHVTPEYLSEAHRLLDLVAGQRPLMRPRCDYWSAVAFCHQRHYDRAAEALESVLASKSSEPDNPHRRLILVEAWQLALLLHPEMKARVGVPQLTYPGRRMEAIAAIERRLAAHPDDKEVWTLKRVLYDGLTESDYHEVASAEKPAASFDHEYCRQLGLALIEDPQRWERGSEYLRIAAYGLPQIGPSLYVQIARANERAGNFKGVWDNYELAKRVGRAVGPKNLTREDRDLYFAVVKALAEDATKHDELDNAIENYRLYVEYERAGVETYRHLADLHERRAEQQKTRDDLWAALRCCEQGLTYDKSDKDLVARKDRYYNSVLPEELEQRFDDVRKWFDIDYCMTKARWLLDRGGEDLELLDWADHLIQLVLVTQSNSLAARVLRARVLRRRGEVEKALQLLEEVRAGRPEKFPSTDEEEAWYLSCRMLGDLYLHEKPEQAVECLQQFKKSPRSGADTDYKLGVAYENLGDRGRAVKCYQRVVAFESHPLAPEAHEALQRLQAPA
ncbi:MAG: tetratricopeptide repeat protein [Gemmataceae bacterium]|nr:tetratricopeptide repeat protein [Gemmataceae bacterium]